ncbi:hypothetical protein, partial [Undibacterium sp. Ji49W]|uniref:CdiA C-terminal domain-containing protein n=1 Tax=Undibacterium sp. Ji49W TaxID=3413040 RepID=UPI003BF13818
LKAQGWDPRYPYNFILPDGSYQTGDPIQSDGSNADWMTEDFMLGNQVMGAVGWQSVGHQSIAPPLGFAQGTNFATRNATTSVGVDSSISTVNVANISDLLNPNDIQVAAGTPNYDSTYWVTAAQQGYGNLPSGTQFIVSGNDDAYILGAPPGIRFDKDPYANNSAGYVIPGSLLVTPSGVVIPTPSIAVGSTQGAATPNFGKLVIEFQSAVNGLSLLLSDPSQALHNFSVNLNNFSINVFGVGFLGSNPENKESNLLINTGGNDSSLSSNTLVNTGGKDPSLSSNTMVNTGGKDSSLSSNTLVNTGGKDSSLSSNTLVNTGGKDSSLSSNGVIMSQQNGGTNQGSINIPDGAIPDSNELLAGQGLANLGYNVTHQPTASSQGIEGVRTADLSVEGVGQVDVYTPTTSNPNSIVRAIEAKNTQASGVLIQTNLSDAEINSVAARTWGKPTAQNIQTLFFQKPDGTIIRIDRP